MSNENWLSLIGALYPNKNHATTPDFDYVGAWEKIRAAGDPKLREKLVCIRRQLQGNGAFFC